MARLPEGTLRASQKHPCPICGKEDACFLIQADDSEDITMVTCYRLYEVPDTKRHEWSRGGLARNGHTIFIAKGAKLKRKHFPSKINLEPRELEPGPQWNHHQPKKPTNGYKPGSIVTLTGKDTPYICRHTKSQKMSGRNRIMQQMSEFSPATAATNWGMGGTREILLSDIDGYCTQQGDQQEQEIEYLYSKRIKDKDVPVGKVIRRQWTDRRKWYADGSSKLKTKTIYRAYWEEGEGKKAGKWTFEGKGNRWPLYREQEVKQEIEQGGIVFAVGGEACVESLRELGLVATCPDGGEGNFERIIEQLEPKFFHAKAQGKKPLLVWWPDFDVTGQTTYGTYALRKSRKAKIPTIVLDPMSVWDQMPHKGDAKDWVEHCGLDPEAMRQQLTRCIDAEIEEQEVLLRAKKQGDRWNAPVSHEGEIGVYKSAKPTEEDPDPEPVFKPLTDFDLDIERMIIDPEGDGGGMFITVKLADEHASKRIFLGSCDFSSPQKFKDALKTGLGYPVFCNLSPTQIEAMLRVKAQRYRVVQKGKTYKLADRSGKQEHRLKDERCWVFPKAQFKPTGEATEETNSGWMWNPNLGSKSEKPTVPVIAEQRDGAIRNLINAMRPAFDSNIEAACMGLGWAAAALHFDEVLEHESGFPILTYDGVPGSGKTTAGKAALSITGCHHQSANAHFSKTSISRIFQQVKTAGCLPHCLDDPEKAQEVEIDEIFKVVYDGGTRMVRDNAQTAHSPVMVTSNHSIGQTNPATASRCLRIFLPKIKIANKAAWREVYHQMPQASGEFKKLLAIGFPETEVQDMTAKLDPYLNHAHDRIPRSMALILVYTQKVLELAGITDIDIESWVIRELCPSLNEQENDGDFLREFLQQVFVLENASQAGPWNMRWVNRDGQEVLALYMPSLWPAYNAHFQPSYNEKVIRSLMKQAGLKTGKQRFHTSIDSSKAWARAKVTMNDPNPPEQKLRSCWEVPKDLLLTYANPEDAPIFPGNTGNEVTDPPQTQTQTEIPLLPKSSSLSNKNNIQVTEGENSPSHTHPSQYQSDTPCAKNSVFVVQSSTCIKSQNHTQNDVQTRVLLPKSETVTPLPADGVTGLKPDGEGDSEVLLPCYPCYPLDLPTIYSVDSEVPKVPGACDSLPSNLEPNELALDSRFLSGWLEHKQKPSPKGFRPDCSVLIDGFWSPAGFDRELKQMKIHPEGGLKVRCKVKLWPSGKRETVWLEEVWKPEVASCR